MHQTLHTLRTLLARIGVANAQVYTLKCYRAGKATALAASGESIGAILQAGEWRSAAFLSYVDEEVVDERQLLEDQLAASDDDACSLPPTPGAFCAASGSSSSSGASAVAPVSG